MAKPSVAPVTSTKTRLSWIDKGRAHKKPELVADLIEALDGHRGYHELVDERIRAAHAAGDDEALVKLLRVQRSLMELNARLRGALRVFAVAVQEESPRR